LSDCFLIASILDAIGLFVTDVMTYKWGGMAGDNAPEPPTEQLIALKKVSYSSMCSDLELKVDD
jgi:hypothetical protein